MGCCHSKSKGRFIQDAEQNSNGNGTPHLVRFVNTISKSSLQNGSSSSSLDIVENKNESVPSEELDLKPVGITPLIEQKQGIEGDTIRFEAHHVKLYIFKNATKEWAERGVGTIQILQKKVRPYQGRIIMWRDHVFQLACNHLISRNMQISFGKNSKKSVVWASIDFVDLKGELSVFQCKFPDETQSLEFKTHFEEMVKS